MEEIKQLLEITKKLKDQHQRSFTLDGKLVGDIGEVLAAEKYGLILLPENNHKHDAKQISTKRLIQIKSSFSDRSYFPCDENKIPDYYLAVKINEDGTLEELFNGTGKYVFDNYIKKEGLKANPNRYLYTLSGNKLRKLNEEVNAEDKIKEV